MWLGPDPFKVANPVQVWVVLILIIILGEDLTTKELISNEETRKHKEKVTEYIMLVCKQLIDRALNHDNTKLESPEVEIFAEYTPRLAECTFDSEEYRGFLEEMKPALDHHYANNRHHPQNHKNGVSDMTIVDIIEMFCDWKAASERHNDGNIKTSLEVNSKKFNITKQLLKILENSVILFDELK